MTSKISWTDETWEVVRGCQRVSPGCEHCYAEALTYRFSQNPKLTGYQGLVELKSGEPRWTGAVRCVPEALLRPRSWSKPRRIFVCSRADLFHRDVPDEFLLRVFETIRFCDAHGFGHTFQVLTKRAERMADFCGRLRFDAKEGRLYLADEYSPGGFTHSLKNLWLGVSVENQRRADERIPLLLQTPAAVRWLSVEPLLGPVDLEAFLSRCDEHGEPSSARCKPDGSPVIDWVVVGGESGPGFRPMRPAWALSLWEQCREAGVPFYYKQGNGPVSNREPWITDSDGARWRIQQYPGQLTPPERVEGEVAP